MGCNPRDMAAVLRLLRLKRRPVDQGVLMVASSIEQIRPFIGPLDDALEAQLQASWPGPVNWVLPASDRCPPWISGGHEGVGVRVSAHPVVRELCELWGGPLVSTSANQAGRPSAMTAGQVATILNGEADFVVPGALGGRQNACEIRSGLSGEILRPG